MNEAKQRVFFPNLDGLRFFSFLPVFMLHSLVTDYAEIDRAPWFIKLQYSTHAYLGVSFFFVLSGFLITYLLIKEKELRGKIDVGAFYVRRVLRIWPLYFFCVLYGFVLTPYLRVLMGQSPEENASPFLSSVFLNNFDRIINGPPNSAVLGVLWSIAVEEQFYLVWPLLLLITPPRRYHWLFIAVIAESLIFRTFYFKPGVEEHTLSVISDMAAGGLVAWAALKNNFFEKFFNRAPRWTGLLIYLVTFILILFYGELLYGYPLGIFRRLIMAICFALIIADQNYNAKSFFKMSRQKTISALGKYTYGLYCLHPIGISVTIVILRFFDLNRYGWQLLLIQIPAALLMSILFSYLSYHIFEKHFLKLKDRFAYIIKDKPDAVKASS